MATYGGGTVFSGVNTTTDIAIGGGSTTVLQGSPAANTYVEFKPLAFYVLSGATGGGSIAAYKLQSDNGAGGWVDTGCEFSVAVAFYGAGQSIGYNLNTNSNEYFKVFPGQRVVATLTATGSFRWSYSAQVYTPST